MKKPIFKNEEEARKHYCDVILFTPNYNGTKFLEEIINNSKEKGYIEQSELEIAKEKYKKSTVDLSSARKSRASQVYINLLEKRIEKLENKKNIKKVSVDIYVYKSPNCLFSDLHIIEHIKLYINGLNVGESFSASEFLCKTEFGISISPSNFIAEENEKLISGIITIQL